MKKLFLYLLSAFLIFSSFSTSSYSKNWNIGLRAEDIYYENEKSQLLSEEVQNAIDETVLTINSRISSSIKWGGELSVNAVDNTKFDIASGEGYIVDSYTDPENPVIKRIFWEEKIGITPIYLNSSLVSAIYLDENGDVQQFLTQISQEALRDYIHLGVLLHFNLTFITEAKNFPNWNQDILLSLDDLHSALGSIINFQGNEYIYNGDNLNIDRNAGSFFSFGSNYSVNKKNPNFIQVASAEAIFFFQAWRGTPTQFIVTDEVDTNYYDPNGDGVLVEIPDGFYTAHRIYHEPLLGLDIVQYGQYLYDSIKKGSFSYQSENFDVIPEVGFSVLKTVLVVSGEANDLSDRDSAKFIQLGILGDKTLSKINSIAEFAESVEILDGMSYQRQDIFLTVESGNVYVDIEKVGGGDLTYVFGQREFILDCTTGSGEAGKARIQLNEGTEQNPQKNWVYVVRGTGETDAVLSVATSSPTGEIAMVATLIIPDDATLLSYGEYGSRRWTEAKEVDGKGVISTILRKLRGFGAKYESGLAANLTIDDVPDPDDVDFTINAGVVEQIYYQNVDALQLSVDGARVVNSEIQPYRRITNLNQILTDSTGTSLANKYYQLVVAISRNLKNGTDQIYINKPNGSYLNASNAFNDVNGYSVTTFPSEYDTITLICAFVLRYSPSGSGSWFNEALGFGVNNIDLRGQTPGVGAGGSGTAAITEFSDGLFRVFDNADDTKEVALECSGITTGTTRTITVPDRDLDLGSPVFDDVRVGGTSTFTDTLTVIGSDGDVSGSLALTNGTIPRFQFINFDEDNLGIYFDCYNDSGTIKSSDADSNFAWAKILNSLRFSVASGNAVGDPVTFTNAMLIASDGDIGIGSVGPFVRLHVQGTSSVLGDGRYMTYLGDDTSVAAGVGGGIAFGGNYTGLTQTPWAAIWSEKENAVDGEYGGELHLGTRANGTANISSALVIDSARDVNIPQQLTIDTNLFVNQDADIISEIGKMKLGNILTGVASDFMGISHYDHASLTNFSLLQSSTGATFLNSAAGQLLSLRINNSDCMVMRNATTVQVGINESTPDTYLHITGAHIVDRGMLELDSTDQVYMSWNTGVGGSGDDGGIVVLHDGTRQWITGWDASEAMWRWFDHRTGQDVDRMVLKQTGELGIGTTSPSSLLHIKGAGNQTIYLESSDNNAVQFRLRSDGENRRIIAEDSGANVKSQIILTDDEISFHGVTTLTDINVGVNTDTPLSELSVAGNVNFGQGVTTGESIIYLGEDISTANKALVIGYDHDSNFARLRILGDSSPLGLTIADGGNVGIGTVSPDEELHVSAASDARIKLESTGDSAARVRCYADRIATDVAVGAFDGYWDGNLIGVIAIETGDDTTNKDDGLITFFTSDGGSISEKMRIEQDGGIYFYNLLGGAIGANPQVWYNTTTKEIAYDTSSMRYKENIIDVPTEDAEIIYQLPIRKFDRKDKSYFGEIGMIAEELAVIDPKLISYIDLNYNARQKAIDNNEARDQLIARKTVLENTIIPLDDPNYTELEEKRLIEISALQEEIDNMPIMEVPEQDIQPETYNKTYFIPHLIKIVQLQKQQIDELSSRLAVLEGGE